jgi:nitroreductase
MTAPEFVPYEPRHLPNLTAEAAAKEFFEIARMRRSVRAFSSRAVSRETIEWIVRCAAAAPSGANKQPWRFVCVADPRVKRVIRQAAEKEEREFYTRRAPKSWLRDLEPLGTDPNKEFLEVAPWLIAVFKLVEGDDASHVYYVHESVGIACGFLLLAAHFAGLSTLTHTPNPMAFLTEALGRPKNEKPYLLIPVGYAADDCQVPAAAIVRKPLEETMVVVGGAPGSAVNG